MRDFGLFLCSQLCCLFYWARLWSFKSWCHCWRGEARKKEKKHQLHFNCNGNGTTAMAVLIQVVSSFHLFVKLRISRFKRVELIIVHCTSTGKKWKRKNAPTNRVWENAPARERDTERKKKIILYGTIVTSIKQPLRAPSMFFFVNFVYYFITFFFSLASSLLARSVRAFVYFCYIFFLFFFFFIFRVTFVFFVQIRFLLFKIHSSSCG